MLPFSTEYGIGSSETEYVPGGRWIVGARKGKATVRTNDTLSTGVIPAGWYTDPAVLEQEREHIFGRTWQWVGRVRAGEGGGGVLHLQGGRRAAGGDPGAGRSVAGAVERMPAQGGAGGAGERDGQAAAVRVELTRFRGR
jgi:hypothetical protein